MAITDTLTTIKDYFINWHKTNYNTLHPTNVTTSFSNPLTNTKVPSEKLVKESLDGKANSNHSHNISEINNLSTILSSKATLDSLEWKRMTVGTYTNKKYNYFSTDTSGKHHFNYDENKTGSTILYYNDYLCVMYLNYFFSSKELSLQGSTWTKILEIPTPNDPNITKEDLYPIQNVTRHLNGAMPIYGQVNNQGEVHILVDGSFVSGSSGTTHKHLGHNLVWQTRYNNGDSSSVANKPYTFIFRGTFVWNRVPEALRPQDTSTDT